MTDRSNSPTGLAAPHSIRIGLLATLALALLGACESTEEKLCRSQYLATHALMQSVDPDDFASVENGMKTVTSTLEACEAAGLHEEIDQLKKVHAKLEKNFNYLRTHGAPKKLTEEELQKLVEEGDPNCPKGQAYNYRDTGKQIRCTGPKLVDMNWAQAEAFYEKRGFKITRDANRLKAEYGSESYTFEYGKPNDTRPAQCIRAFAAPGIPWQESVARLTGTAPHRLKEGQPVKLANRELELSHTQDETQAIYQLGECSKP